MSSLFRLPALLTRPVGFVLDTTVALLALPGRVLGLVATAEQTLAAVNDARTRTEEHLERTGQIIGQVDGVVQAASRAVAAAALTVEQVDHLTASAAPLLESYSEPLRRLEPTLRRMVDTTAPHEVDALVTLIDRLPRLAHAMDGDVIPLLGRIEQIGPDLNQLLDSVSDLNHMMNRMPKMFRRRRESSTGAT
jgi:ABC-type transporter Mla subunit MlaD